MSDKHLSTAGKDAIRQWIVDGIAASAINSDGEREALPWVLTGGLDRLLDAVYAAQAPTPGALRSIGGALHAAACDGGCGEREMAVGLCLAVAGGREAGE